MATTTRSARSLLVSRYSIIGTTRTVYEAFESYAGHSTIETFDGVRMGRVGTGAFECALPYGSRERIAALGTLRALDSLRAEEAIHAAFPETEGYSARDCEIVIG